MYRRATFETAELLARGIPPRDIAHAYGVKPNTIQKRRQRFDRQVGGRTPRLGKAGRPAAPIVDCDGQRMMFEDVPIR